MKRKNFIILFLLLAIMLPILGASSTHISEILKDTQAEEAESLLSYSPYHADAGIHLEENLYFKKYTITLHEGIGEVNYCHNKNWIDLTFSSGSVDNLTVSNKDIMNFLFAKKSSGNVILSIKTEFKENYVYTDLETPNKVTVLVSKKKNPYIAKVTLDPGHGGEDPGTNRKYKDEVIYEKDITLNVALMCEPILRYNGINVALTRNTDIYMPGCKTENEDLAKRVDLANDSNSDIFVSIHVDANDDPSCSGVSLYYAQKQKKSERLATMVNNEFKHNTPWQTKDIVPSTYFVLEKTKMPGILIECGFLTNENDIIRLSKISEQHKISKTISTGILKFFNE